MPLTYIPFQLPITSSPFKTQLSFELSPSASPYETTITVRKISVLQKMLFWPVIKTGWTLPLVGTHDSYLKIQINTMRPLVTSTYLMLHTCCVSLVVLEARKSSQPYLGFYNPFPPRNDQILYNFASSPPSMSQGNSCNAKVLKHFPPKCSLPRSLEIINLTIFPQWTRRIPSDKMTRPPQDITLYTRPTRDCLVRLGTRAFLEVGGGSNSTVWCGAMPSPRATTSGKCGSWPRGFTTRGSGAAGEQAKVLQSLVMSKGRRGACNPQKSTELSETLYQQQQQGQCSCQNSVVTTCHRQKLS